MTANIIFKKQGVRCSIPLPCTRLLLAAIGTFFRDGDGYSRQDFCNLDTLLSSMDVATLSGFSTICVASRMPLPTATQQRAICYLLPSLGAKVTQWEMKYSDLAALGTYSLPVFDIWDAERAELVSPRVVARSAKACIFGGAC